MNGSLIFFLLILGLIVGGLAYGWWWNQHGGGRAERERLEAESKKRGQRLSMQGWEYEARHVGDIRYFVSGITPGGHPWRVEYDCDHSSSSSTPKLRFLVDSLCGGDHEWELMDRWAADLVRKGLSGKVIGGLAALSGALSEAFARKRDFFF